MDEESIVYVEAFVEAPHHGYRWRVSESDPGQLEIEYQEWSDKAKAWQRKGAGLSIPAMHAKDFCDAITRVAATARV